MSDVLVIDDDTWVLRNVGFILELEGYQVRMAENGEAGLELMKEQAPDLIICDVAMPGISGFDILKTVKANRVTRDTPVIMITGIRDEEVTGKILAAGAAAYLSKPFTVDQLKETLARCL
jgi:CheY-like chemotaxis protein